MNIYEEISQIISDLEHKDADVVAMGVQALQDFRSNHPESQYDFSKSSYQALIGNTNTLDDQCSLFLVKELLPVGLLSDFDLVLIWKTFEKRGTSVLIQYADVLTAHLAKYRDGTLNPEDTILRMFALSNLEVLAHVLKWAFSFGHFRDLGSLMKPFLEKNPNPQLECEILNLFVKEFKKIDASDYEIIYLSECIASPSISSAARKTLSTLNTINRPDQ